MSSYGSPAIQLILSAPAVITEGSVIERFRRNHPNLLDPFVANASCVYDDGARKTIKTIYRQYLDIGSAASVPTIVLTPTWRANPERVQRAGLSDRNVNRDCVVFLKDIRAEYPDFSGNIFIGGLMGCRGDAYDPSDALPAEKAFRFHQSQARDLAEAGADFMIASTIPSLSEALGMARAMSLFGPYMISFVIRRSGDILDGTPLADAVRKIDESVSARPAGYMVNCVHPLVFSHAMKRLRAISPDLNKRIIGFQANTSRKPPEELEGSPVLLTENPESFAGIMESIRRLYGLRIVGGCCGTDERHIREIASLMARDNMSAECFGKEPE